MRTFRYFGSTDDFATGSLTDVTKTIDESDTGAEDLTHRLERHRFNTQGMCLYRGTQQGRHGVAIRAGGYHDLFAVDLEAMATHTGDLTCTSRESGNRRLITYLNAEFASRRQISHHGRLMGCHAAIRQVDRVT